VEFKLKTEFIELDNLLKAIGIVSSGADAKSLILEGAVKVNGVAETRTRRKLRTGDIVETGENKILIIKES
jgi:ribosome-associated protein